MEIIWSSRFESDVRYYFKKKKYTKILDDIDKVVSELKAGNFIGDRLENVNISDNLAVYKVRIANTSVNLGKSNGFRMIYYLKFGEKIYLVTIYSKKDDNRIPTDAQIVELIKTLLNPEQS